MEKVNIRYGLDMVKFSELEVNQPFVLVSKHGFQNMLIKLDLHEYVEGPVLKSNHNEINAFSLSKMQLEHIFTDAMCVPVNLDVTSNINYGGDDIGKNSK